MVLCRLLYWFFALRHSTSTPNAGDGFPCAQQLFATLSSNAARGAKPPSRGAGQGSQQERQEQLPRSPWRVIPPRPEPPHVQNHPLLSNYSSADKSTGQQPGGSSRLRCSRVPALWLSTAWDAGGAKTGGEPAEGQTLNALICHPESEIRV